MFGSEIADYRQFLRFNRRQSMTIGDKTSVSPSLEADGKSEIRPHCSGIVTGLVTNNGQVSKPYCNVFEKYRSYRLIADIIQENDELHHSFEISL
uniref:Uncharacterized protein n=1 Tax=Romanomermis culicivorax TaxID=13658 RepID=A0A915IZ52_ROMCU